MSKAVLLLGIFLLLSSCASPPNYSGGAAGLPPCGGFPNCVHSMSGRGYQAIEPLSATSDQWRALKRFVEQRENWSLKENRVHFIHAVAVTPLMRFRDDIQLLYTPELETIHVRSSSRVGISDMGVNRKRIELLRQYLQTIK